MTDNQEPATGPPRKTPAPASPEPNDELRVDLTWPFRLGMSLPRSILTAIWPSVARHVMPAVGNHVIPAIAKYFVPALSISLIVYSLCYGLSLLIRK